MDRFETWMDSLWQKTRTERNRLNAEKGGRCTCPSCPTYTPCAEGHNELLYCIAGESRHCITDDHGCSCQGCPLTAELDLAFHDFCLKGSEAAQRREREAR